MNVSSDTIVALSSPPPDGIAPRAILRLSGPAAWEAARTVLPGMPLRTGFHGGLAMPLLDAELPAAAGLLFKGPRSFTGEDIAELHIPGSPALIAAAGDTLLRVPGLRQATAGEFSARAFFNGKIDLTEAEGIAATIHATDQLERRAAASLRKGDLFQEITRLTESLANTLALLEAGIDFTEEEDVHFVEPAAVHAALRDLIASCDRLLHESVRVDRLHAPPTIVFIGAPNVGKSSLINVLTGQDRSIVSPIAGTTRDMLVAILHTAHGDMRLLDVPGTEKALDELRKRMMAARHAALLEADLIVEVIDAADPAAYEPSDVREFPAALLRVYNKSDIAGPAPFAAGETAGSIPLETHRVSARTAEGIDLLRRTLVDQARRRTSLAQRTLALNQRHRVLIKSARTDLLLARQTLEDAGLRNPELIALSLRLALDDLGRITGAISPDEILGRIFSTFCIGK